MGKTNLPSYQRRLSVSVKPSISPLSKSSGTVNSTSETKAKTSMKGEGSNEKAVSEMRKSMSRKKFSVLSSVSYWLSQIKLSESASKHSVSLGFFKLALESGCEPLPRMRYELKLYVAQHNLVEFGEPLEELLLSYNISDDMEQVHISENCSQIPGETTQSSEGIHSSLSSIDGRKNIKPKSLSTENNQTSSVAKLANRWNHQRVFVSMEAMNRNASNSNNGLHVQVSETCSQIAGETTQSSEGVHNSSSSINGGKRLKPKSLGSENIQTSSVVKSANGGNRQRIFVSKVPVNKNASKSDIVDFGCGLPKKKSRRPNRQFGKKENVKNQNQEEKIVGDKDLVELLPNGETEQDDKENKDVPQPEEICSSPEQVSDIEQTIWPRPAVAAEWMWTTYDMLVKNPRQVTARLSHFRCLLNQRGVAAAPLAGQGRAAPGEPGSCYKQ